MLNDFIHLVEPGWIIHKMMIKEFHLVLLDENCVSRVAIY